MGRLSNSEIKYIKEHSVNKSAQEISEELNRSVRTVKKYIEETPPKSAALTAGSQFARQKSDKGDVLSTVMTPNASQVSDDNKQKNADEHKKNIRRKQQSYIHRIR